MYLLWRLLLKKLWAGGNERIDKPGAVFPCTATDLFDTVLNKMIVPALRLDDMEVVFAPAGVNVGVAGVLLFLPFMMGFQRPCRVALVLSNRKIACCAILLLSPFRSFPGLFHRKIPQKISRIGREWIEYKSIFLSLYFYIPSDFRTSRGLIIVLVGCGFQSSGVP